MLVEEEEASFPVNHHTGKTQSLDGRWDGFVVVPTEPGEVRMLQSRR